MKRTINNKLTSSLAAGLLLAAGGAAVAGPVNGLFREDSRGDALADLSLHREIGDVTTFPAVDAIAYHDHRFSGIVGVADDGIANDWLVHITNVSGQAWRDLFFVADHGAAIGNADGQVEDLTGAPGVMTDAFRIDALGINANLLYESVSVDGILQPGEEWEFAVMNFNTGAHSAPPVIITPWQFAGSSQLGPLGGTSSGNASILAIPVPEPSTVGMIAFVALSLLVRRPRREPKSRI